MPVKISAYLILLLFFCCESGNEKNDEDKAFPNIIYILADDLGYGDVSSFHPEGKIRTPHLDRLAEEGMRFTDAHTSSSVCTPTRYGILTGRYNWRSPLKQGVLWGESPALIPRERSTVASLLQGAGYYTAYIGKWHLGWNWGRAPDGEIDFSLPIAHSPNDLGFDYAYGHVASLDMAPYVYVENGRCTAVPTDTTVNTGMQFWREGLTAPDFVHEDVTPNFFRRAIGLIEERAAGKQPFFLYLPLPSPHTPILPTEAWQGRSGLNPYGDFVLMIDDFVGQLLDAVERAGITDNTLVIFTSDNGCSPQARFEELAAKGHDPSAGFRGHKADIFEGGHRVPFIARWPARIAPGGSCGRTICTTDLLATCSAFVGARLPEYAGEDSFSLLPLFDDPGAGDYGRQATVHHSINGEFAIRADNWKLITCPGSGGWSAPRPGRDDLTGLPLFQLYDLHTDPGEQNNLYASRPDKAAELKRMLADLIRRGRSTPGTEARNDPPMDAERGWPQTTWMEETEN